MPDSERRIDVVSELRGVREGLAEMSRIMATSFPEERIRTIVQQSQRRTVLVVLLALAVTLGTWAQSRINNNTLNEAKVTADYVRDCIQHPDLLTAEKRAEKCGPSSSGTSQAVGALIQFQKCALLIQPTARTDENMNACVTSAMSKLAGR